MRFAFQRDAVWCEASERACRTHRGAAVRNLIKVGADGYSRYRVKGC